MTRKPLKEILVDIGGEEILIQIFPKCINFSHWKDGEERWATVKNDKGVRLYTPNSPSKDLWKPRIPVATVYFDYWQGAKKTYYSFRYPSRDPSDDITEKVADTLGVKERDITKEGKMHYENGFESLKKKISSLVLLKDEDDLKWEKL